MIEDPTIRIIVAIALLLIALYPFTFAFIKVFFIDEYVNYRDKKQYAKEYKNKEMERKLS